VVAVHERQVKTPGFAEESRKRDLRLLRVEVHRLIDPSLDLERLWKPPAIARLSYLRACLSLLRASVCATCGEHVEGDGSGPGLLTGAERFTGERLEVLCEAPL
jgi:hypothetical protein